VSQKTSKIICYNYVKLPPKPTIFGTKMANCLKLYEVPRVSRRCSELSHNAVGLIVSFRLLTIASSIRQMAPHDLIIL